MAAMMQQPQTTADPAESGAGATDSGAEAPPKLVALAMDRLASAARLIADIRIGADRLLEALFLSTDAAQNPAKTSQLILKEEAAMRQHFQDLRALGKQLEDSGVLTSSLRSRGNSWGLHMPLVCPDGAVVAYAWKRQLAGQAGASAVDRTRLALKAFSDQKRRFFPHLEDEVSGHAHDAEPGVTKKRYSPRGLFSSQRDLKEKTLSEVLKDLEEEMPYVRILTYQRRDWTKRASLLTSSASDSSNHSNKFRSGSITSAAADHTAVIELLVPSVFRAVVSLHPAGSTNPDAVSFFSTTEGGNYIHTRGLSIHYLFRQITAHAEKALQYFLSTDEKMSLSLILHWICSHHKLFSKVCSACGRLMVMDKSSALLLPPVHRAYRESSAVKPCQTESVTSEKGISMDFSVAYHVGCSADD